MLTFNLKKEWFEKTKNCENFVRIFKFLVLFFREIFSRENF